MDSASGEFMHCYVPLTYQWHIIFTGACPAAFLLFFLYCQFDVIGLLFDMRGPQLDSPLEFDSGQRGGVTMYLVVRRLLSLLERLRWK